MIVDTCQRWTLGRESRRPAGELIRPAAYDVAPIADAGAARAFVALHHYAASSSPAAYRYGLYLRAELVGVALFGPPASMAAHRAVFPTLRIDEAATLGRLVLLDAVPGNGESWFVAACFARLRAAGVVAADIERGIAEANDGAVSSAQHVAAQAARIAGLEASVNALTARVDWYRSLAGEAP